MTQLTRRQVLAGTAGALFARTALCAQEAAPAAQRPTFTAGVDLVPVFVTVRDRKGAIVKDLAQEEFTLSEDGRPQALSFFSRESDLPLTIGLLVDTTPSEADMLDVERRASLAFLDRMLRPEKDKAFLIQYYSKVEVLQELTSSPDQLRTAMWRLQSHGFEQANREEDPDRDRDRDRDGDRDRDRGRTDDKWWERGRSTTRARRGPYETVLADAIVRATDDILRDVPGRKALLILGDGDHVGDREEEAIAAAQRADTLVYTIRIYDKDFGGGRGGQGIPIGMPGMGGFGRGGGGFGGGPGGGGPGGGRGGGFGGGPQGGRGGMDRGQEKKNLQEISRHTGGAYYEIGRDQTLAQIYEAIEEELRSQYSLGYTPDASARAGYRKITVDVRRRGVVVRGRDGYYGTRAGRR
jgi:VWFA-related protein